MSDYGQFIQERFTIDAIGWDPLVAPATLSQVLIRNIGQVALKFRTDSTDLGTEDTIGIGILFPIQPSRLAAFRKDDIVGFVQAESGTGTMVVQWLT